MKTKQHYGNHNRPNALYYLFLLPLTIGFFGLSVYLFSTEGWQQLRWFDAYYHLLAGVIALTSVILLRTYSITNQKRNIRLEMRLRYFTVTGQPFNGLERKLSTGQLNALRYASDAELVILIAATIQEKLSPDEIKKKIRQWKGDYYQV